MRRPRYTAALVAARDAAQAAGRFVQQGVARGQKHGTLDRDDPELGDARPWAATSHTGMREQGRTPRRSDVTVKQNHALAGDGCWCGRPMGHDWPGRATGKPHPPAPGEIRMWT